MSEKKRRMVGLLVMTEMPDGELVAVLQRRGEFNHEKLEGILSHKRPVSAGWSESFPGGYSLTVWGGMEDGETSIQAMIREVQEEMGQEFYGLLLSQELAPPVQPIFYPVIGEDPEALLKEMEDEPKDLSRITEVYSFEDKENLKIAYAVKMPCACLASMRFNPSSGGIRLLRENQIEDLRKLEIFPEDVGVIDKNLTALREDCIATIKIAFVMLARK